MWNMTALIRRFISATLLLLHTLILSSALQAHAQDLRHIPLSDKDKSEIVESVLQQELKAQSSEFEILTNLSSENIEFIDPSKISKLGLILISDAYLRERKKDNIVEYVIFKRIEPKGERVIVAVSRVVEGRPCFGPAFSSERNFIYEYYRESGHWTGEMVRNALPFLFYKNVNTKR